MIYPVVLHKDKGSDFGVTVPDLPGCFSAGRTVEAALAMAHEAIELHLEGLIAEGLTMPRPSTIERHRRNPAYRGGAWALVAVDETRLRTNSKRINITMPERILAAVDRYAAAHGETRSGLLALAATEYIGRAGEKTGRPPKGRPRHRART